MRFLGQHEFAGPRQRFKSRFRQRRKLILAVTIGKNRKRVEVEPVVARLIEGLKNPWLIRIPATTFEERISFVATVTSKISVQQINHRPQMAPLFDVHLKQIA